MALWVLLAPNSAYPCGLCREDNRAAVYSYEALQRVKAHPDELEFVVIKMTGSLSAKTVDNLGQWLSWRRGVEATTLKISSLQKSMGFVYEKKTQDKQILLMELQETFPDLSFKILD